MLTVFENIARFVLGYSTDNLSSFVLFLSLQISKNDLE